MRYIVCFLLLIIFFFTKSIFTIEPPKDIYLRFRQALEKNKISDKRSKIIVYAYDYSDNSDVIPCGIKSLDKAEEEQIKNYFITNGYNVNASDGYIKPEDSKTNKCVTRPFELEGVDTIIFYSKFYSGFAFLRFFFKEIFPASIFSVLGKENPAFYSDLTFTDNHGKITKSKYPKWINGISLEAQHLTKISGVELLQKVKWVNFASNLLSEMPSISSENIEKVNFRYNRFKFFPDLRLYKNLKIFEIGNNQIEELNEGVLAENLEEIYLSQNYLRNLKGLEGLKKLKILSARQNKIEFVDNLKSIQSLEKVYLSVNQIRFINDEFNNLTNLKLLELDLNELIEISKLANPNLENLSIAGNRIDDLTGISRNKNLRVLDIRDNPVTDITELGKLGKLEKLFLDDKAILRSQILELQRVNSKLVVEFRRKGK